MLVPTLVLVPIAGGLLALLAAAVLTGVVLRSPEGNDTMKRISAAIRTGARAYLRRQYRTVSIVFAVIFVILFGLSLAGLVNQWAPYAFVVGGFVSALAGFVGMTVATQANSRTAEAARQGLNRGLRVAFSAGSVMGLTVVGLGIVYITLWYLFLLWYYGGPQFTLADREAGIASAMLILGLGASLMALFARVGGGIYTKAADVGADLVGKVEAGIPEDDARNPAVIADNVGDNVGDVAGMGADLYESYVSATVATCALAIAAGFGIEGVAVPLAVAGVGAVASIIGGFFVSTREGASQQDLLGALRRGVIASSVLIAGASALVIIPTLGLGFYLACMAGLLAGIIVGASTEYYTAGDRRPALSIADQTETGPATTIIGGIAVGMQSTMIPVLTIAIGVMAAFMLAGGHADFESGIFGVGLAAVGMLSTLGITLATDAYGPVADNAGGIAQMSHLGPEVRARTDALDSLGNTTAATGKGFAIGSAAMTALVLIAAFKDEVQHRLPQIPLTLDLSDPFVISGLFVGAMLPFLFSAMTMQAVGRAAGSIVLEVRRQFREIPGLLEGRTGVQADYARCVDISTAGAQREMILPSLTAIIAPVVVGLISLKALGGLLAGALVSGFVLAIMMANAGGAWDNAKKAIEGGLKGGKGSDAHKAAVVGDTVGDPFKDTSGPSINILIKLISIVAIVFTPLFMAFTIFP